MRGVIIAVFVACALLAVRLVVNLLGGDGATSGDTQAFKIPEPRAGEVRVEQAINIASTRPITVRGYVFNDGESRLRLCDRMLEGDPPKCVGPYITLENADANLFALDTKKDEDGFTVAWVDEPVAIRGMVNGTLMSVETVLR